MTKITAQEQAEFDHQGEVADQLLASALDDIPADVDDIGVLYSLWVAITHILADAGWTGEQLASDAHHHAASATTEGAMQ
jgi:hypothetical protein